MVEINFMILLIFNFVSCTDDSGSRFQINLFWFMIAELTKSSLKKEPIKDWGKILGNN